MNNFSLEIYKKFNKIKHVNCDLYAKIVNDKNNIASLYDFYVKYPYFNVNEYKKKLAIKELTNFNSLIYWHLNEKYKDLYFEHNKQSYFSLKIYKLCNNVYEKEENILYDYYINNNINFNNIIYSIETFLHFTPKYNLKLDENSIISWIINNKTSNMLFDKENLFFLEQLNINHCNYEYFIKIKQFMDIYFSNEWNYVSIFEKIISNPKYEFRYFCFRFIDYYKNISVKSFAQKSKKETVIIEFREFPHIEFLIRNTIHKLSEDWAHSVVCGNNNYNMIKNICNSISSNINIIKINIDNVSSTEYNNFMTSMQFWNNIKGNKVLIYQEDSCIFKSNINEFLQYDYIGAPWPMSKNVNKKHVGNGGFSLRNKQIMIDIVNKWTTKNTDFGIIINEHVAKFDEYVAPEDIYFTTNMINNDLGNIADYSVASSFSVEAIYNCDPFGGHNFFIGMKNTWLNHLYTHTINGYINIESITNFDRNNWYTYNKVSKINSKCDYNFIININDITNNFSNNGNNIIENVKTFENDFGFIITRHVNTKITNEFWKRSYEFIRKIYPNNLIVIIDDNSNQDFITHNFDFYNTIIINSEFNFNPGEYLPYYYLNKYHFFDKAIILHDGMFVNKEININNEAFLWHFDVGYENHTYEQYLIYKLNSKYVEELITLHNSSDKWKGCFGCCCVINYNTVKLFFDKYHLANIMTSITLRTHRSCLERIIALLFYNEKIISNDNCSIFGDIKQVPKNFELSYTDYLDNKDFWTNEYTITKLWTGR